MLCFSVEGNQHVVGWLEGLWYHQPTRVQVQVLASISGFISEFPAMRIQWEETFPSMLAFIPKFISGFPAMRIQWEETFPLSLSEVLIGVGCAFIGVSVCACI